jgi:hypothetical protein
MSAQGSLRVRISPPCVIASSFQECGILARLGWVIARHACMCPVLEPEQNIRLGASRARDVLVQRHVCVLHLVDRTLAPDSISS